VKNFHKSATVFATRFHPDTTEDEIYSYVSLQFVGAKDIKCEKLQTKFNAYASFKLSMTWISFKDYLDIENWPVGIFVKRLYSLTANSSSIAEAPSSAETPKNKIQS